MLFNYQSLGSTSKSSLKKNKKLQIENKNTSKKLKLIFKKTQTSVPFKVEILVEKQGTPWGMVFLNKEELLWTEKEGKIKKIHLPTGKITNFIKNIPNLYVKKQGGLLDVALHPHFQQNQYLYLVYSFQKDKKSTIALGRGKLEGNAITNFQVLFKVKPFIVSNLHFGSRIVFDDQGFLFMTTGDRYKKQEAQKLETHFGKLLRMTDTGKPAPNNPFIKSKNTLPEIWSFGHRNPQGLFIHPETKQIYIQEHGPKGGDEINLIKKGANYGWPTITYGKAYSGLKIGEGTHKKGMEQALKYWTPSIAPSGLLIYSGKKFSKWKGDFFSGSLVLTHLNKLKFKNSKFFEEQRLLSSLGFRFRHVIEGPEGFIYTSIDQGMILKISPL